MTCPYAFAILFFVSEQALSIVSESSPCTNKQKKKSLHLSARLNQLRIVCGRVRLRDLILWSDHTPYLPATLIWRSILKRRVKLIVQCLTLRSRMRSPQKCYHQKTGLQFSVKWKENHRKRAETNRQREGGPA